MTSVSSSGSWSRDRILWIQVAAFLRHATVSTETVDAIRVQLFNPRHLHSVSITSSDQGLRVAYWMLTINWVQHSALLSSHSTVSPRDFKLNQEAHGVAEILEMVEEHFARSGGIRGWGFTSALSFPLACALIGAKAGSPVRNHPNLRRLGGLHVPGLTELTIEAYGIE